MLQRFFNSGVIARSKVFRSITSEFSTTGLPFSDKSYTMRNESYYPKFSIMTSRTRSLFKGIALLMVLLAVVMELQIIIIPALSAYSFWVVVAAFGVLLLSSK